MIDAAEVNRVARLLRRQWPWIDPHDALSCAGEAAVEVGTDDGAVLVVVSRRRAIDLWRTLHGRRGTRRPFDPSPVADDRADDGCSVEGVVGDRLEVERLLALLPPRYRFLAGALAEGYLPSEVAVVLGVTPSRVSQLRREMAALAAA